MKNLKRILVVLALNICAGEIVAQMNNQPVAGNLDKIGRASCRERV